MFKNCIESTAQKIDCGIYYSLIPYIDYMSITYNMISAPLNLGHRLEVELLLLLINRSGSEISVNRLLDCIPGLRRRVNKVRVCNCVS